MKRAFAVLAVAGFAGVASAQNVMTWSWEVSGGGVINPGESATLKLYAQFSSPPGVAYAGSIFDIIGTGNWDTGTVVSHTISDKLNAFAPHDGLLQPNNDILVIDTFQLPKFFNPGIDESNPIYVYEIEWQPNDYTNRMVSGTTSNHLNNSVYTDDFGTSVEFDGVINGFSFQVVPAPASLALVGLGGLVAARRRRA